MGKTFVYNTGKEEVPANEIWKEFGLFFDGTLNNKDNTELREKVQNNTATTLELEVLLVEIMKVKEFLITVILTGGEFVKLISNMKRIISTQHL